jgi:hypothetical protein
MRQGLPCRQWHATETVGLVRGVGLVDQPPDEITAGVLTDFENHRF